VISGGGSRPGSKRHKSEQIRGSPRMSAYIWTIQGSPSYCLLLGSFATGLDGCSKRQEKRLEEHVDHNWDVVGTDSRHYRFTLSLHLEKHQHARLHPRNTLAPPELSSLFLCALSVCLPPTILHCIDQKSHLASSSRPVLWSSARTPGHPT
jgi:hypothetical protein